MYVSNKETDSITVAIDVFFFFFPLSSKISQLIVRLNRSKYIVTKWSKAKRRKRKRKTVHGNEKFNNHVNYVNYKQTKSITFVHACDNEWQYSFFVVAIFLDPLRRTRLEFWFSETNKGQASCCAFFSLIFCRHCLFENIDDKNSIH